jgi:7-cyano-7-deazaguanine synthase
MDSKFDGVIIVSGGLDSTTLLYHLVKQNLKITALSFDYGQRHSRELVCACWQCDSLKVPHKIIDLGNIKQLLQGSSLTSPEIVTPEGHYAQENMKLTVVPNRNMIMLSLAIACAISLKAPKVWYGAHAGDHAIYPDCRPAFVKAMQRTADLCDWNPVDIEAPFLGIDKAGIVSIGLELGVRYDQTWTCYSGREKACGKCGSCSERLEAFEKNHLKDPLEYEH